MASVTDFDGWGELRYGLGGFPSRQFGSEQSEQVVELQRASGFREWFPASAEGTGREGRPARCEVAGPWAALQLRQSTVLPARHALSGRYGGRQVPRDVFGALFARGWSSR